MHPVSNKHFFVMREPFRFTCETARERPRAHGGKEHKGTPRRLSTLNTPKMLIGAHDKILPPGRITPDRGPKAELRCRKHCGAGVRACGLWRRLAASFQFTRRDGARTRRRGRLRHARDVFKKSDAPAGKAIPSHVHARILINWEKYLQIF
jgi:hypothetical protein